MSNNNYISAISESMDEVTGTIRVIEIDAQDQLMHTKYTGAKLAKAFHESRVVGASNGSFKVTVLGMVSQ